MKTFLTLTILLLLPIQTIGMNSHDSNPTITDFPDFRIKVHNESNILLTISNFAQIGNGHDLEDPDGDGIAPGAEFPANSELDYLFLGGIWIGAEVDTVDQYGNPIIDTLVSAGLDGWMSIDSEMVPTPGDEESLWEEQNLGDQEYFAVYTDTLTDPSYIPIDYIDQRPHIPLGLEITQHSLCWSSPGYDETFTINYVLDNIGGRDLHNVWFAMYIDADVWHRGENPYGNEQGAQDDLTGFIEHDDKGIAWFADNNGQPYDGEFDVRSPTGATGMFLLGSTEQNLQTNFNWWISNTIAELDWGPQLQSNFDIWGNFPCGGRGTPCGDKAKYQVMSNGERDYDMIWAALGHTDEGWIPSVDNINNIANGYDTRYLLSFGPLQIAAGETDTISIAYFGARDLHIDPMNYENYLRYNTDDSVSIAQYYQNLDFSDMVAKADSAFSYYSQGYLNIPPGAPHDFHVEQWSEEEISLRWEYSERPNLLEYRIYRGTEPGVYDPEKITPDGFIDSVFIDTDVENNTIYYYVISTAGTNGSQGGYSPEVFVNSGQPYTPTGLTASSERLEIYLDWNENPDTDLAGYIVYRAGPGEDFMTFDTTAVNSYIDDDVYIGAEYSYRISAFDISGNESFYSDDVSSYAMGLDSGILLVMMNSPAQNPDLDSMIVFYERLLSEYPHLLIRYRPQNMHLLASFSTVIFTVDHIMAQRYFDIYDGQELFSDYLEAGGNLILAGSRQVTPSKTFYGQLGYQQHQFPNRYFNLQGIEFPDIYNTEFSGGHSESPFYDDFPVDTTRAGRIIFPPIDEEGRLHGIGTIIPNDPDETIFSYISADPDTSILHGNPIGLIHHTETYSTAVLEFPLYYVREPFSFDIVTRILEEFGEIRVGTDEDEIELPKKVELFQNFPNPFNPETIIKFNLAQTGNAAIAVYNIIGQKVAMLREGRLEAGEHSVRWNAENLPSGIYFARLTTEDVNKTIKMILLK